MLGARVVFGEDSTRAFVRFEEAETHFAKGLWVGLELESESGKHDGAVGGRRYFAAPKKRGAFVKASQVRQAAGDGSGGDSSAWPAALAADVGFARDLCCFAGAERWGGSEGWAELEEAWAEARAAAAYADVGGNVAAAHGGAAVALGGALARCRGVSCGARGRMLELVLSDNDLAGTLPRSVGGCTALEVLQLDKNRLAGALPTELGRLRALRSLMLADNELGGDIPGEALAQCAALTEIDLSWNRFEGAVPAELARLPALQELYLDHNHLAGQVPAALAGAPELAVLWLSDNALAVGASELPPALADKAASGALDLQHEPQAAPAQQAAAAAEPADAEQAPAVMVPSTRATTATATVAAATHVAQEPERLRAEQALTSLPIDALRHRLIDAERRCATAEQRAQGLAATAATHEHEAAAQRRAHAQALAAQQEEMARTIEGRAEALAAERCECVRAQLAVELEQQEVRARGEQQELRERLEEEHARALRALREEHEALLADAAGKAHMATQANTETAVEGTSQCKTEPDAHPEPQAGGSAAVDWRDACSELEATVASLRHELAAANMRADRAEASAADAPDAPVPDDGATGAVGDAAEGQAGASSAATNAAADAAAVEAATSARVAAEGRAAEAIAQLCEVEAQAAARLASAVAAARETAVAKARVELDDALREQAAAHATALDEAMRQRADETATTIERAVERQQQQSELARAREEAALDKLHLTQAEADTKVRAAEESARAKVTAEVEAMRKELEAAIAAAAAAKEAKKRQAEQHAKDLSNVMKLTKGVVQTKERELGQQIESERQAALDKGKQDVADALRRAKREHSDKLSEVLTAKERDLKKQHASDKASQDIKQQSVLELAVSAAIEKREHELAMQHRDALRTKDAKHERTLQHALDDAHAAHSKKMEAMMKGAAQQGLKRVRAAEAKGEADLRDAQQKARLEAEEEARRTRGQHEAELERVAADAAQARERELAAQAERLALKQERAVTEAVALRSEEAARAAESQRRMDAREAEKRLAEALAARDEEQEKSMQTVLNLTKSAMAAKDQALEAGADSAAEKIQLTLESKEAEHLAKVAGLESAASRTAEMVTRLQSALAAQQAESARQLREALDEQEQEAETELERRLQQQQERFEAEAQPQRERLEALEAQRQEEEAAWRAEAEERLATALREKELELRAVHREELQELEDSQLRLASRARDDAVRVACAAAQKEHDAALAFARAQFDEEKLAALQAATDANSSTAQELGEAQRQTQLEMQHALVTAQAEIEALRGKLRQARSDGEAALHANEEAREAEAAQRYRAEELAQQVARLRIDVEKGELMVQQQARAAAQAEEKLAKQPQQLPPWPPQQAHMQADGEQAQQHQHQHQHHQHHQHQHEHQHQHQHQHQVQQSSAPPAPVLPPQHALAAQAAHLNEEPIIIEHAAASKGHAAQDGSTTGVDGRDSMDDSDSAGEAGGKPSEGDELAALERALGRGETVKRWLRYSAFSNFHEGLEEDTPELADGLPPFPPKHAGIGGFFGSSSGEAWQEQRRAMLDAFMSTATAAATDARVKLVDAETGAALEGADEMKARARCLLMQLLRRGASDAGTRLRLGPARDGGALKQIAASPVPDDAPDFEEFDILAGGTDSEAALGAAPEPHAGPVAAPPKSLETSIVPAPGTPAEDCAESNEDRDVVLGAMHKLEAARRHDAEQAAEEQRRVVEVRAVPTAEAQAVDAARQRQVTVQKRVEANAAVVANLRERLAAIERAVTVKQATPLTREQVRDIAARRSELQASLDRAQKEGAAAAMAARDAVGDVATAQSHAAAARASQQRKQRIVKRTSDSASSLLRSEVEGIAAALSRRHGRIAFAAFVAPLRKLHDAIEATKGSGPQSGDYGAAATGRTKRHATNGAAATTVAENQQARAFDGGSIGGATKATPAAEITIVLGDGSAATRKVALGLKFGNGDGSRSAPPPTISGLENAAVPEFGSDDDFESVGPPHALNLGGDDEDEPMWDDGAAAFEQIDQPYGDSGTDGASAQHGGGALAGALAAQVADGVAEADPGGSVCDECFMAAPDHEEWCSALL
eukprot:g1662.t1